MSAKAKTKSANKRILSGSSSYADFAQLDVLRKRLRKKIKQFIKENNEFLKRLEKGPRK